MFFSYLSKKKKRNHMFQLKLIDEDGDRSSLDDSFNDWLTMPSGGPP